MAEGGPKRPKMHLFFRCFFPLSFYLQTENLLWLDCQSRFFYKLKGEAFASPFSIFFFSYARMMTGSPVVPSMPAWISTVLPSIWFT